MTGLFTLLATALAAGLLLGALAATVAIGLLLSRRCPGVGRAARRAQLARAQAYRLQLTVRVDPRGHCRIVEIPHLKPPRRLP